MPRYKLTIAYDGTDFCGWQKQEPLAPDAAGAGTVPPAPFGPATPLIESTRPGRVALRTVQGVVEQAARAITREPVELIGASRTDAGVHARGQVAAFTCEPRADEPPATPATAAHASGTPAQRKAAGDGQPLLDATPDAPRGNGWPLSRGTHRLLAALNSRLPDDVVILTAEHADNAFDPVADVASKEYTYTFHCSPHRPLWERRTVHHVWHPAGLDAAAMHAAAQSLVGEHDFAAFAAAGHGRLSTVRTIHALAVESPAPDRVVMRICASGFLWNMVRIIGGTLMEVGTGRRDAAGVRAALESRDRAKAGPTLPPTGLCLEWIRYR